MSSEINKNKFLSNPHEIIQESGRLTYILEKKVAEGFPNTCVAMDKAANAGVRDDAHKKRDNDDYSISLQTLLNAFDVFIKEYTHGKNKTGQIENYDLSNSCEFTIYLLWQIRHTWTHNGGVIDRKCKKEYEKIIQKGSIDTKIDIPKEITEGYQFSITMEDFDIINGCIMKYIEERVSPEDFIVISARRSFTDMKFDSAITVNYDFGSVIINLEKAFDKGCEYDPKTGEFILPLGTRYYHQTQRFYFPDGEWLSAKLIRVCQVFSDNDESCSA